MQTIEERVADLVGGRELSPYKVSKLATMVVGRYVREQLVYSYVRQGLIKASKDVEGAWYIKPEDAEAWLIKYGRKHTELKYA